MGDPEKDWFIVDVRAPLFRDHSFHSQTRYNDMTATLRTQLEWCTAGININPLEYINILRPLVHKYNAGRMYRYLSREIDQRYSSIQDQTEKRTKSIVDLALKAYLDENP